MIIERDIQVDTEPDELYLVFLTLTHPELREPIRVVSDPENFIYDGEEYTGFQFDIQLLSDNDSPPRAKLSVQNVDRIIGQVLLDTVNPARIDIKLITGSQFDLTALPRIPIGTPALTYHAQELYLTEVECNSQIISGTIRSWDYTQELWTGLRATENRFPAIYW